MAIADGACAARSRREEEDDALPSSTTTNEEIARNPRLPNGLRARVRTQTLSYADEHLGYIQFDLWAQQLSCYFGIDHLVHEITPMNKQSKPWTIKDLKNRFTDIDFPDYQREATVWPLGTKQLLIDSILRKFDIASLYFYEDEDAGLSCIDGRQRINAIMSFLGENPEDQSDNQFRLRISNEIYTDTANSFCALDRYTYKDILVAVDAKNPVAIEAKKAILDYQLTAIILSGVTTPGEFNLQFTRLNLGAIINAGEKLHAMVGKMRDLCFVDQTVGQHPFLEIVSIPTRRYAKEQVVAQVLIHMFSLKLHGHLAKARHFDLQKFFKQYVTLSEDDHALVSELTRTLAALKQVFPDAGLYLRNRAITVSAVLVAWKQKVFEDKDKANTYVEFLRAFLSRLKWQLKRRADITVGMDREYHYLIDFQRHVTQAAVEKSAVEERGKTMTEEYLRWSSTGWIGGDEDFQNRVKADPNDLSQRLDMEQR